MPEPTPLAKKIAALKELRADANEAETAAALRSSLKDRSSHVVAKAAELCGEFGGMDFAGEMLEAYQRTFINPVKRDPGCLAKTAIATTLVNLDWQDAEPFRQGIKYRQYEPVWGGREDTAASLRAICAGGMVSCATRMEAITCFADLLADPCKVARIGAARAIAGLGHWEGVPLLRLKVQLGDEEAEVLSECCAALLGLEPEENFELVVQLLSSRDADIRVQVALALGESRVGRAFEPLCGCWRAEHDLSIRGILLTSIGLLRTVESRDFLVSLVAAEDGRAAADAIRALALFRSLEGLRDRLEEAVAKADSSRLRAVFEEAFG